MESKSKNHFVIALIAICLIACIAACVAIVASAGNSIETVGEMVAISTDFADYLVQDTVRVSDDGYVGAVQYTVYYDTKCGDVKTGYEGTPVVVYTVNHPAVKRIGTDSNKEIISSMLERGYVVVVLDYLNSEKAVSPAIDNSSQAFRSDLRTGKILKADIFPSGTYDENFLAPSGYNVLLNQVFWEIDKHATEGTFEKIVENWNSDFRATKGSKLVYWAHSDGTRKAVQPDLDGNPAVWYDASGKVDTSGKYTYIRYTKAETITDCVDPDGSFIDMNLYINLVYPTSPASEVPVMSLANSSGYPTTSVTSADLRPHSNGFLYNGYANAVFDYLWVPMARNASWGYYDGSAGITKDHMNYAVMMYNDKLVNTAAMRYLRYISLSDTERYNFDLDAFGVYGNSKGGWFSFLGEADVQAPLVDASKYSDITALHNAIDARLSAFIPDRYYNGHHGETRYQVGAGSITADGFTVKAGEVQPWLTYNGEEIISGCQLTNACNGSQEEDITAGHAPIFISGNMTDTYNAAYSYSVNIYNACRELDIPLLHFEVPIGHTLTSGMDMNYNTDTYDAYFRYIGYYLKGDAISVAYVSPMDNAGRVSVTDKIVIGFAGEADAAAVSKITVTCGENTVSGSWESSFGGTVWTFIPDALIGGTEYTITVPADFAGENGVQMGKAYTASFITETDIAAKAVASGNYYTLTVPSLTVGNSFAFRFLITNDAANIAALYAVSSVGQTGGTRLGSVNLRGRGSYEIDITDYAVKNAGKEVVFRLDTKTAANVGVVDYSFDTDTSALSKNGNVQFTSAVTVGERTALGAYVKTPTAHGVSVYYDNPTHVFTYKGITGGELPTDENLGRRYHISFWIYDTTERVLQFKLNTKTNRVTYGTIDYDHVYRTVRTEANKWQKIEFTYEVYEADYGLTALTGSQSLAVYVSPDGNTNAPIYFDELKVTEQITAADVSAAYVAEKNNGRGTYTPPISDSPFAVYNGTALVGQYGTLKAAFAAYKTGYTVKLQSDYILTDSDLYDGMGAFAEVNIDLAGHTLTSANTKNSFIWAKAASGPDTVTVINLSGGSVLLGRTPLISYEGSSDKGSGKSFEIKLSDVYVGFTENAYTTEIISGSTAPVGVKLSVSVDLADCTLDLPENRHARDSAIALPSPANSDLQLSYSVSGGEIYLSSQRWITVLDNATIVDFERDASGNYTTLKMPLSVTKDVLGSYLIEDGYAAYKKSGTVSDNIVTYTLVKPDNSTRYGIIPEEYLDKEAYPFAVFKDGVFNSAHADLAAAITAVGNLLPDDGSANKTAEILLRRNFDNSVEPTYGASAGTVIIDLGGHTITRNKVIINAVVNSGTPMHKTAVVFKNGRLETAKNVMAVTHTLYETDKTKVYDFTFDNITFGFASGYSPANANGIFWGQWNNKPTNIDTKMLFNECIFDFKTNAPSGGGTPFTFTAKNFDYDIEIRGGKFLTGSTAFKMMNTDAEDIVTVTKGENGYPTVEGGSVVNGSFLCDDGKYRAFEKNTSTGEIEFNVDKLVTPYGSIGSQFADAEKYPFAVFFDGSFVGAYTHFANTVDNNETTDTMDAIQAAKNKVNGAGGSGKTVYILLRRNYVADYLGTAEGYNNLSQFGGTLVIDLGGFTYTTGNGIMLDATAKSTGGIIHDTGVTVKNGTLVLGAKVLVKVSSTSGLTSPKSFNFEFDNVTFKASATVSKSIIYTEKGAGSATPTLNARFNGCTFDYTEAASAHTLFNLTHTNDNVASNITVTNSKFISNAAALSKLTIAATAGNDRIEFGTDTVLEYPASETPTAIAFPMGNSDGYFAKMSVAGATATYILEPATTVGGTVSSGTVTQNPEYLSAIDYPFFVFEGGVLKSAQKTWKAAVEAARALVSATTDTPDSLVYIVMRRDYDVSKASSDAGTNFNSARGTIVVDLGGYRLNAHDTYIIDIHIGYASSNATSILNYVSSIKFMNGTIRNSRTNLTSIGLGHDSALPSGYSRKHFSFEFENVTFEAIVHPIMQDWGHDAPTGLEIDVTCNDCTFDFTYSTGKPAVFQFATSKTNVIFNGEFNGTKIIAPDYASFNIYTKGGEDKVVIGKGENGSYMTLTQDSSAAAPKNEFYNASGLVLSFGKDSDNGSEAVYILGEPIKTSYGYIPFMYQSTEKYPFVVFNENGVVIGASDVFYGANLGASAFGVAKDYLAANVYNGTEYTGTVRSAYIILRRNYTMAENETYNNVAQVQGVLTIDLGGNTFTLANTRTMFPSTIKPWGGSGDAKVFPSIFEIVNGEIIIRNKSVIEYGVWTGGKESTNTPGTDVSGKAFDFHFTNVSFKLAGSAQSPILSYFKNGDTPNAEGNPTVIFNDCEFDLSGASTGTVLFNLGNGFTHTTVIVNGGQITADSADIVIYKKVDGCKSDITFGKPDGGNYTLLILPAGAAAPSGEYNTKVGAAVFVKASENAETVVYRLCPKAIVDLDFVPRSSIVLGSELVFNVYVPANDALVSFTLDGVTYTDPRTLELVSVDGKDYYRIGIALPSGRALRDITLTADVDVNGRVATATCTFSLTKYAELVLSDVSITDVEKALVLDVLSYVRAAYAYFGSEDADKIAKVNALLGENYDEGSAPVMSGDAEEPTVGISAVTYNLDATPGVRFYLAEGYEASDFTFSVLGETVTRTAVGEDKNGRYVEVILYAYQLADTVSYTVGGVTDSYSIRCYYEWAKTKSNDALVLLVERFAKYCESAAVYRDAVIDGK
ncbi:MAG: Ig-like domain-containing protein [Clostridia bacterium]|nr:Ig-like domain-containing protein [Clostridia bacterium]